MKKQLKAFSMGILVFFSMMLTSCEYFVDVDFVIATTPQDTLVIQRWGPSYEGRCDTIPFTNMPGETFEEVFTNLGVCPITNMGGPSVSVSTDQAFATLMAEYDSVRIIRKSDGASTITYRHDENATEAQRLFFRPEAWNCSPEGEELKSRTYSFKITDDMFR